MDLEELSGREAIGLHRRLVESLDGKFPEWGRDWIVAALSEGTTIREQYRKMEWDLEAEIVKAAQELRRSERDHEGDRRPGFRCMTAGRDAANGR